jgi:hypothetical protein
LSRGHRTAHQLQGHVIPLKAQAANELKDEAFAAAVEQARGQGRATLRRRQWHRANNGSDTMLIWLGKNMLGQSDRHELGGPGGGPIEMVVTGVRRAMDIEGDATEVPLDPEPDVVTGVQRTIEDDTAD